MRIKYKILYELICCPLRVNRGENQSMRLFKILFLAWVMTFVSVQANAQQEGETTKPGVAVIARALQDSIMLRWGPNTPVVWELANKYGYKIERITVLRDFKLLETPERRLLTPNAIKLWPMNRWEKLADEDDNGAIAAQALFGETFEITEEFGSDMMQVVNKARELEMRFSFALFTADQSLKVAEASGLYYVDKDVKEGEKYLYRIYAEIPKETIALDTGNVYVGTMDYGKLPSPTDMHARLEGKAVELSWNRANFDGIYNSYNLEKSSNGVDFIKVNDKPIVNAFQGDAPKSRYMFRMDTLSEYNIEYQYRVRGISPFGEIGPSSDTARIMARVTNNHNPVIIEKENIDNNSIHLKWQFDSVHVDKIQSFSVLRTPNPKAPYDTIAQGLAPSQREFVDGAPGLANYYIVAAKDHAGLYQYSFPALAQLVDSIPPAPPTGLVGVIDTTGIVTLTWKPNEDNDIWGYRIYRANYNEEEYSQLTVSPVPNEVFYDTIPLDNLNERIYYKILAVDHRSNGSDFSDPLELIKPDLVPPMAPVIKKVLSSESGVELHIIPSGSADVLKHLVYRKNINQTRWSLIQSFDSLKNEIVFQDTTLNDYKKYTYTVIAVDDSELESDPAQPVEGKKIDKGIRDQIEKIYAEADRESRLISIEWQYEKRGVDRFLIYKNFEDQGFKLYKTLPGEQRKFEDRTLKINTIYKYKIMAIYKSGARSSFSREVEVNY